MIKTVTVQRESYEDCIKELKPMLEQHYQEVEWGIDERPLEPQYDLFWQLDKYDECTIFTARHKGELVGYSVFILMYPTHHATTLHALNDVLYLDVDFRNKDQAVKLIDFAEDYLSKKLDVKVIQYTMKTTHTFETLMTGTGHEETERVFSKFIG